MMAVAGLLKKHPLSGGQLPAERLGVIALGDQLLAVNDVVRNHYIFLPPAWGQSSGAGST